MNTELDKVYDPESFRKEGHILIDILADHLDRMQNLNETENTVLNFVKPADELTFWNNFNGTSPEDIFNTILERSIHLHHPHFMGHQVSAPAPLSALASLQGALLNNGMAVYEMGAAATALESYVINLFKGYFGYDSNADGILTSGGTIANLTALLCARSNTTQNDIWQEGTNEQYAFMVSEEAHYCIDRAVRIMGWGNNGIIKIPVDNNFRMKTDLLQSYLDDAKKKGIKVLGVVGSAPTTSTGIYDDLKAIGHFCEEHKLWFHIDAAHGGPAAFSSKYKYLMDGSELADSITVDAHKMMMTPALTTMLFFKNASASYRTFAQKADYLWNADDTEWYNYGKRTMECTKLMMSTRIYVLAQAYGVKIFKDYLDTCYDLAKEFARLIQDYPSFELAVEPDSNIVCFRWKEGPEESLNGENEKIRQHLLEDGKFYIVKTSLKGRIFLRTSLMNAKTTIDDLKKLLDEIMSIVKLFSI
ncbi:MAG: aminotransferase class V-fold PLP-dependent enzyme [Saprospiraceae bacterium]|nr:aminotransferase class V-fold PLP-dependent enzyme [Saprospiraceae bacterium]